MAELSSSDTEDKSKNDSIAEENNVITMVDVLEEEQELEDDALAVLGASDVNNCTYSKGYVKRQALYACVTCIPFTKDGVFKPGGVCLACSYSCHEGHELVELYTKRNFRCDCGNAKFLNGPESRKCILESGKAPENEFNTYNHNFFGVYCTCNRPYPDPDDDVADEMLQCIICEDWYHGRHLGTTVPSCHEYSEMICVNCMEKHEFLWSYRGLMVTKVEKENESLSNTMVVNITESPDAVKSEQSSQADSVTEQSSQADSVTEQSSQADSVTAQSSQADSVTEQSSQADSVTEQKNEGSVKENGITILNGIENTEQPKLEACKLHKSDTTFKMSGAAFFIEGWRKVLCTCDSCQNMYSARGLSFITDEQDTVQAYEEKGKCSKEVSNGNSQYEQGMRALSSLDRTQQIEAIVEYNTMKTELKEYLQKFAENKKIVREEDIREFFSMMEDRKRRRLNAAAPQYFCR